MNPLKRIGLVAIAALAAVDGHRAPKRLRTDQTESIMKNKRLTGLAATLLPLLITSGGLAQPVIFDATFDSEPLGPLGVQAKTDPLPLRLPNSIIRDASSDRVDVSMPNGDFTSRVMLLDSTPGNLASAAFFNPVQYVHGIYLISWDSLVTQMPVSNFEAQMTAVQNHEGHWTSTFTLSYDPSGAFRIGSFRVGDAPSGPLVGHFSVGQHQHFQVLLDMDFHSYSLRVDNVLLHNGALFGTAGFNHTVFHSLGRGSAADFPPWAVDNVRIEAVPEPTSVALGALTLGMALCLLRSQRARWSLR